MIACGDPQRPQGWINGNVVEAFTRLYELGYAHSVEVWDVHGDLVGGLYGLEIGGIFVGESMFHLSRDASKAALVHLGRIMNDTPGRIIDSQWMTEHLQSLGAREIARSEYCKLVANKRGMPSAFASDTA